jgi:carbon monoxide dehydrogenase subunit G
MRVKTDICISAPRDAIWAFVSDPERYLHFMAGITRWESRTEEPEGGPASGGPKMDVGTRFRMLMQVRSAEIGGLVEVVEFTEPADIAWNSVTGIDQRGRWRLREREDGRTDVELRLSYGIAGAGISGWIAEHVAAPTVSGHLRRSLQQLKRQVEHEELRRAAAERREARQRAGSTSG